MRGKSRSYTLEQVQQQTGFDKRTIAYYVQEGVLPKVGRRGPRTRYPQRFLDRLLFIKRIRDLQNEGRMGTMTLGEIRDVFEQLPDTEIADLAAGRRPIEPVAHGSYRPELQREIAKARQSAPIVDDRIEGFPIDTRDVDLLVGPTPTIADEDLEHLQRPGPPAAESRPADDLVLLLRRIQRAAGRASSGRAPRSEHWTRAHVTPEITISVRNLEEDAVPSLEELADALRQMTRQEDDS